MTTDTDHQAPNGHQAAPAADIPFGDQPNQVLSPTWAEGVLRELYEHHLDVFGRCLTAYTTGIRAAKRGRKPEAAR